MPGLDWFDVFVSFVELEEPEQQTLTLGRILPHYVYSQKVCDM